MGNPPVDPEKGTIRVPHTAKDNRIIFDYYFPEKLRKQHPQIVELIEKQDLFSALSAAKEAMLCSSIFEIDYFRERSITSMTYVPRSIDKYVVQPLVLDTEIHPQQLNN